MLGNIQLHSQTWEGFGNETRQHESMDVVSEEVRQEAGPDVI